MRATIVEYFRSRHILTHNGPAPMDIGALKGKGKGGKKGSGKLSQTTRAKLNLLKGLRKGKGKGGHWNFHAKAKGKAQQNFGNNFGKKGKGKQYLGSASASSSSTSVPGKGKGKGSGQQLCWNCWKPGHFSDQCPQKRVNLLLGELSDPYLGWDDESWYDDFGEWNEGDETYPLAAVDDFVDQALLAELDPTWWDDGTWDESTWDLSAEASAQWPQELSNTPPVPVWSQNPTLRLEQ